MRSLAEIAKEIATEAVATAQCAGYDFRADRAVFAVSDTLDLEDLITTWLHDHMRPQAADRASLAENA